MVIEDASIGKNLGMCVKTSCSGFPKRIHSLGLTHKYTLQYTIIFPWAVLIIGLMTAYLKLSNVARTAQTILGMAGPEGPRKAGENRPP
eukprot:1158086-Pelagomonas_calceolata.AAC.22